MIESPADRAVAPVTAKTVAALGELALAGELCDDAGGAGRTASPGALRRPVDRLDAMGFGPRKGAETP
jgi:hypothetical protein